MRYILILLVLCSCNPCQRLWKRCPPIIVDSVRVDSIWSIDTLQLILPGDTVMIGEETLKGFGIIIDTERQRVTRRKDKIEFICKEDSLQRLVNRLELRLMDKKIVIRETPVYLPQKYIPNIYKIALWVLIGMIGAGLGYGIIKLSKRF